MEALNWKELEKTPLPRNVYLDVLFHKLTLPELEQFAPLDENDSRRKLVQAYYNTCAIFSPPTNAYVDPYDYDEFNEARLNFCREMIRQGADFNPANLDLECYKLIGVKNKDIIVFNPLLFLLTSGNQTVLDRIYAHALENDKSLQSFGFQIGMPLRAALKTHEYEEEEREVILRHFVNTQWAICTYQSIEKFEEQYEQLCAGIDDEHNDLIHEINKKLLVYARKTYNHTLENYLELHCQKTPEQKLSLIETGTNALYLRDTKEPVNEKIVLHMLYRHSQNTPAEENQASTLAKAIKDKTTFFRLDDTDKTSTLGKITALAANFSPSIH
ncbi:MAG TPA: hypothetical protein VGV92_07105 [Gammaproteobacteria bacterium]|nr:hypothetical protein [Gammaproteobacteria bacterium]